MLYSIYHKVSINHTARDFFEIITFDILRTRFVVKLVIPPVSIRKSLILVGPGHLTVLFELIYWFPLCRLALYQYISLQPGAGVLADIEERWITHF